jgi:hypothetical protein
MGFPTITSGIQTSWSYTAIRFPLQVALRLLFGNPIQAWRKHKPLKIKNQQNKSSILEEEIAAHPEKQAKYPPSLYSHSFSLTGSIKTAVWESHSSLEDI